MLFAVE
jgi:hypothetical protein